MDLGLKLGAFFLEELFSVLAFRGVLLMLVLVMLVLGLKTLDFLQQALILRAEFTDLCLQVVFKGLQGLTVWAWLVLDSVGLRLAVVHDMLWHCHHEFLVRDETALFIF